MNEMNTNNEDNETIETEADCLSSFIKKKLNEGSVRDRLLKLMLNQFSILVMFGVVDQFSTGNTVSLRCSAVYPAA